MMTTTSYILETPAPLWDGYDDLVTGRINDRIVCLMAVDVLANQSAVPDRTVKAAETILQQSTVDLGEVSHAVES